MKLIQTQDYLLLIDEEAEIKENTNTFKEGFNGDWFWNSKYNSIQRTGDITEFDFKIIAYHPLTKEAKELDLPLLPLVGLETEEEIIQSLTTQQLPKEFIPEFIDNGEEDWIGDDINGEPFWNEKLELKTITNSEGKQELVGTYN